MKGLLVTYWFLPKESIATQRTKSFYKYFNEKGIQLDVICPDWGKIESIYPDTQIFQTHKIDQKIFQFKRTLKTKIKEFFLYKIFKYNYFRDSKKGSFYNESIKLIEKINLEDYDFIITSYNPVDVLHIGNYIKTKNKNIKWIIDYRDYYSLNYYMDFGIFRPHFKKIEKTITQSSDAFTTVSKTLKIGIENLIEKPGTVIYNGYENLNTSDLNKELKRKLNSLPIISYCGSLYNGKRDIQQFFSFYSENKLDKKFQFVFALLDDKDEKLVNETVIHLKLENVIVFINLSHQDSLSIINHSKYLMLFSDFDEKSNGFLSGKVFEYMPFRKPIIYSGKTENFELYDLIVNTKIGECYTKFNFNNNNPTEGEIISYHREKQAEELISFVKTICN